MTNQIFEHRCSNGLQLLVEPVAGVQSAAFTFLTPAGVVYDPVDHLGTANLVSMLVTRGAGRYDSRQLTNALDNLGVQRAESAEIYHTTFSAATLAKSLLPALELTADVIRRPHLLPEHLEFCKAATLQDLKALEDEPPQKVFVELRKHALPDPLGRPTLGTQEHVAGTTIETAGSFCRQCYVPNGSILGVAGAVDPDEVRREVDRLFGEWEPQPHEPLTPGTRQPSVSHIRSEKVQTHIGIACESVSYGDADYFNAHGAVGVLSGGMSARLFTEVRERRGLCYTVSASYSALKDRGVVLCYAGTTSERANQTLEVVLRELERLREGISDDEVRRVKAGLKSALIMQEESTVARATVLARSWHNLGRVRTLPEVAAAIEQITPGSIMGYLDRRPFQNYNILTLGPQPLEVPS